MPMEKYLALPKSDGFTLIETILMLGILSLMLVLAVPFSTNLLKNQQEKQFKDILQSDVLFIQSMSDKKDDQIKIVFHDNAYTVRINKVRTDFKKRLYPKGWTLSERLDPVISFSKGLIKKPKTIKFHKNNNKEVKFVFPLGKGRGYFSE